MIQIQSNAGPPAATHDRYLPATYSITHRTEYAYSAAVAVCQNQLRMTPTDSPTIKVHQTETTIFPTPDNLECHQDYFGNQVQTFSVEALHEKLSVEVTSKVTVHPIRPDESHPTVLWQSMVEQLRDPVKHDLLPVAEYSFPSPTIRPSEDFRRYALKSFENEPSLTKATLDLTKRIQAEFRYDGQVTKVDTPVRESFKLRAGVCQDFAQIQIACLRSIGLAARYVSGYLRTTPPPGQPRLVGADESHAWVSVYTGSVGGWQSFDPTNGCRANRDHVPICRGRDYLDVSPMRGVAVGGGTATLKVSVDVVEIDDTDQPNS